MNRIEHLMIDGYGGSQELMAQPELVRKLTHDVSKMVGGTLSEEPYVIPYFEGLIPDDGGVSVIASYEEGGHSAIHTFDTKRTVFLDLAIMNSRAVLAKREEVRQALAAAFELNRTDVFDRNNITSEGQLPACFGPHLMIDGQLPKRFDLEGLYDFIDEMPKTIGMTSIAKPSVIKRVNGGLTGIGVIAESHIALHQEPDGKFAFDIFSCKEFDVNRVYRILDEKGIPRNHKSLIARGLDFPR